MLTYKTILLCFMLTLVGQAQELAPNAPQDKPVRATKETVSKLEKAVAPYIAEGQKSYPEARKRYLAGLPEKQIFFVTVKLTDNEGHFELVFLRVAKIDVDKNEVTGRIANQIGSVRGYRYKQELTLPESRILDWTISKPDGSEEGNAVGKFLDTYKGD